MITEVPTIYVPDFGARRLTPVCRLIALIIASACVGILIMALAVRPEPRGVGSHTQLGFDRCGFLDRTGLPCPTCGMTTSFAWFVRGNLLASLYIQPMGFLAATLTASGFWIALYAAISGRPVQRLLQMVPYRYYLLPLMFLGVASWGWKMLLQIRQLDGWL